MLVFLSLTNMTKGGSRRHRRRCRRCHHRHCRRRRRWAQYSLPQNSDTWVTSSFCLILSLSLSLSLSPPHTLTQSYTHPYSRRPRCLHSHTRTLSLTPHTLTQYLSLSETCLENCWKLLNINLSGFEERDPLSLYFEYINPTWWKKIDFWVRKLIPGILSLGRVLLILKTRLVREKKNSTKKKWASFVPSLIPIYPEKKFQFFLFMSGPNPAPAGRLAGPGSKSALPRSIG